MGKKCGGDGGISSGEKVRPGLYRWDWEEVGGEGDWAYKIQRNGKQRQTDHHLIYPALWQTVGAPLKILQPTSSTPRGSQLSTI